MATAATTTEGEAASAGLEGVEGAADVFPPFDATTFPSQLLWLLVSFVIFYYLMANVALPRIAGILESRRDRIASDLDTAQRLKQDSDEAIATYEAALSDARANAYGIAEGARETAREAADARRNQIEADLAGKLADAEQRIADIKGAALKEVGTIASETAAAIVEKLAGLSAKEGEVNSAVAAAMDERG